MKDNNQIFSTIGQIQDLPPSTKELQTTIVTSIVNWASFSKCNRGVLVLRAPSV